MGDPWDSDPVQASPPTVRERLAVWLGFARWLVGRSASSPAERSGTPT